MRRCNINFELLIAALEKIEANKFHMKYVSIIGSRVVRLDSLDVEMFKEFGKTACPVGWYKVLINPNLNSGKISDEFNETFHFTNFFFYAGGLLKSKHGVIHKITLDSNTTLNTWLDAAKAWLDGGEILNQNNY